MLLSELKKQLSEDCRILVHKHQKEVALLPLQDNHIDMKRGMTCINVV